MCTVVFPVFSETPLTFQLATGALLVACLAHCVGEFGLQTASVFLVISAIVGWVSEELGVTMGIVFPHYHYGDQLGRLLGHVPIIVPPSWMVFTYAGFMLARLNIPAKAGTSRHIPQILFGAWVMACLDLALEPLAILREYWYWDGNRSFPTTQALLFLGWLFWGTVSQSAFHWWIARHGKADGEKRGFRLFPLLVVTGVALYATIITTRAWGLAFAVLSGVSLGPLVIWTLLRKKSETTVPL